MSIPTPPDLVRGKVSWTVGRTDGTTLPGARGTVRFEATAVAVTYSTATVLPAPVETPVVAGVMTPVDLLVNDPEVWNWRVTPRLGVGWDPFHIDVPSEGLDLASAVIVPGKGFVRVVRGEPGAAVTGAEDLGDGTFRFTLEDGTVTAPIELPPGTPGPGNSLSIGTVAQGTEAVATITGETPAQKLNLTLPRGTKGDKGNPGAASTVPGPANVLKIGTVKEGPTAEATIAGTSPSQTLSLTLPKGEPGKDGTTPVLTWVGTALAVNGVTGPDLKGETGADSTVPGPTGKTAYQYALDKGFEGTEEEFGQAQLPEQMSWGNLSGKPTVFPPATHTHAATDVASGVFDAARIPAIPVSKVTGLQAGLDGKAASDHTHSWAVITGKPATFAPSSHTHPWADITGAPAKFPPEEHSHTWASITSKPTTFAPTIGSTATTAAAGNHTHAWAAITGKPTTFDPAAHTHTVSDVTGLQTDLDGKADSSHSHTWAQVTGKPSTFTPAAHTHTWAQVTGKPTTLSTVHDLLVPSDWSLQNGQVLRQVLPDGRNHYTMDLTMKREGEALVLSTEYVTIGTVLPAAVCTGNNSRYAMALAGTSYSFITLHTGTGVLRARVPAGVGDATIVTGGILSVVLVWAD